MKLVQLVAPIALATIVNIVLFGLAWKATQQEKRRGRAPWYLEVGLVAYIATYGLILYLLNHKPLTGPAEIFGAAFIGEAAGALVISALMHSIFRRDVQPIGQRIFEIGASIFMMLIVIAGLFS